MQDKIILHVDINNFYASAALLYNPELRGKDFVVCGDPDKRHGVVLAKNESAKKKGVKTGDTLSEARKKVKGLFAVPPDFQKYSFLSQKAIAIYKEYTPLVESFGLDECWLDVTETANLFGSGEEIAHQIRERMKTEVGLTVSVGVSFSKVFAKLGSDMKKPDAVTVISRENYRTIVWGLPAQEMLYIGRSSIGRLHELGIQTIGDLANSDVVKLGLMFGKVGEKMFLMARGEDDDPVGASDAVYLPESVSNGTTTERDVTTMEQAKSVVYGLSEVIAFRLRRYGLLASGVSLWIRNSDLKTVSKQTILTHPSDDAKEIADQALELMKKLHRFGSDHPIRMITVGTYGLVQPGQKEVQSSFFDEPDNRGDQIHKKLDGLRKKYGYDILKRGVEINPAFQVDLKDVEDGYIPFDRNNAKKDPLFDGTDPD